MSVHLTHHVTRLAATVCSTDLQQQMCPEQSLVHMHADTACVPSRTCHSMYAFGWSLGPRSWPGSANYMPPGEGSSMPWASKRMHCMASSSCLLVSIHAASCMLLACILHASELRSAQLPTACCCTVSALSSLPPPEWFDCMSSLHVACPNPAAKYAVVAPSSAPIMQVLLSYAPISCQGWLLQCKQARATGTVPCLFTCSAGQQSHHHCHQQQQQHLSTASPRGQADFTPARLEVTAP